MDQLPPQKRIEFLKLKIREAYNIFAEKSDSLDKPGPLKEE